MADELSTVDRAVAAALARALVREIQAEREKPQKGAA